MSIDSLESISATLVVLSATIYIILERVKGFLPFKERMLPLYPILLGMALGYPLLSSQIENPIMRVMLGIVCGYQAAWGHDAVQSVIPKREST
jgi:hypothetical protein